MSRLRRDALYGPDFRHLAFPPGRVRGNHWRGALVEARFFCVEVSDPARTTCSLAVRFHGSKLKLMPSPFVKTGVPLRSTLICCRQPPSYNRLNDRLESLAQIGDYRARHSRPNGDVVYGEACWSANCASSLAGRSRGSVHRLCIDCSR